MSEEDRLVMLQIYAFLQLFAQGGITPTPYLKSEADELSKKLGMIIERDEVKQ